MHHQAGRKGRDDGPKDGKGHDGTSPPFELRFAHRQGRLEDDGGQQHTHKQLLIEHHRIDGGTGNHVQEDTDERPDQDANGRLGEEVDVETLHQHLGTLAQQQDKGGR